MGRRLDNSSARTNQGAHGKHGHDDRALPLVAHQAVQMGTGGDRLVQLRNFRSWLPGWAWKNLPRLVAPPEWADLPTPLGAPDGTPRPSDCGVSAVASGSGVRLRTSARMHVRCGRSATPEGFSAIAEGGPARGVAFETRSLRERGVLEHPFRDGPSAHWQRMRGSARTCHSSKRRPST